MSKPKYCANCQFFSRQSEKHAYHACKVAPQTDIDIVSGDGRYPSCDHQREDGGPCGPEAKLYKADRSTLLAISVLAAIALITLLITATHLHDDDKFQKLPAQLPAVHHR